MIFVENIQRNGRCFMKKRNKILLAVSIISLIIFTTLGIFVYALNVSDAMPILEQIVGIRDIDLATGDVNGDGVVNILDVIYKMRGKSVGSISFDDNRYSIDFDKNTYTYNVTLPEGRPRIPYVSATADDGVSVDIKQATIADDEASGKAVVTFDGNTVYTINFVRESSGGFALQYDDRYTFTPDYTLGSGESFTFASSDSSVASVDAATGVITAVNVSNNPVTITASAGGNVVDSLVINHIDKARLNLFFVTGQSNAEGCYDKLDSETYEGVGAVELPQVVLPEAQGQVYNINSYNSRVENPRTVDTWYDLYNTPRQGMASALGTTYYNLSGEKVVFIQSAYNGSCIESWLEAGSEDSTTHSGYNHYTSTLRSYNYLMDYLSDKGDLYELNHTANFWLQGETCQSMNWDFSQKTWVSASASGRPLMTDQEYYDYYVRIHEQMERDFGLEYSGILLARNHSSISDSTGVRSAISAIRASQYTLGNLRDDIAVCSRVSDIALMSSSSQTSAEGYGYMGVKSVHYTQKGHNANGVTSAQNYFYSIDADTDSTATSVEIIDTDGLTRYNSNSVIELEMGATKRLAAMALPEYSAEEVSWSSSDEQIATVSEFGLVEAKGIGEVVITATAGNGVKLSVRFNCTGEVVTDAHFRWDFNDSSMASSADKNQLKLSVLSTSYGAGSYMSITDGCYVSTNTTSKNRPNYTMQYPIILTSTDDWSIEWRSKINSATTIMGAEYSAESYESSSNGAIGANRIYIADSVASYGYGVHIEGNDGFSVDLPIASTSNDATSLMRNAMNTWKITYNATTGEMTLWLKNTTSGEFEVRSTKSDLGKFECRMTDLFGRYTKEGLVNFQGSIDYLDVNAKTVLKDNAKDYHYRWDFNEGNEYASSADSNSLTLSTLSSQYNAGANGVFSDGYYECNASTYSDRPNYTMDKPIVLTSDSNWTIEWRAQLYEYSALMGQEHSTKNFMYLAYKVSGFEIPYCFRLVDENGNGMEIAYASTLNEAVELNENMNTWQVSYNAATRTLTLSVQTEASGGNFEPLGTLVVENDFKCTFTNIFGRHTENGLVNFKGKIDYLDVMFTY